MDLNKRKLKFQVNWSDIHVKCVLFFVPTDKASSQEPYQITQWGMLFQHLFIFQWKLSERLWF